jgi:D-arabinose 1-dehydrogenase-like Zn-dependent alcohol dehydrogenase
MPSEREAAVLSSATRENAGQSVGQGGAYMKAIAVFPGRPNSVHLASLAKPSLAEIPNGRGVLVKVLRVGVDGTDKEINAAEYGAAPPGYDFLVTGHESFGQVEGVGANVSELKPGDYVVATVRRPGHSIYDQIGTYDMTTDDTYYERGINLRHGYLTEYYVDDTEYIVKVPDGLRDVAVLLEPLTVVEKGIAQAYEIQRRLRVWRPRRAAVIGAGTIGLLATLVLRLRGARGDRVRAHPEAVSQRRAARRHRWPLHLDPGGAVSRRRQAGGTVRYHPRGIGPVELGVRRYAGAGEERGAGAHQRHRR